ncbi:MAG TPA: hemerythrin domain-containing protein [Candidatus Binataceae bacterium]|nr:hemerythrin domain-containing protein [Candidatus Binataceae bacterium]
MSEVTTAIYHRHERLLRDLHEQSAKFFAETSEQNADRLLILLRDDLLRDAEGEERELYPLIDRIAKTVGGRATATMSIDHEYFGEYVDWIAATLHALHSATGTHRDVLLGQVRRYLVQLEAILNLHLEKEERLFLPLIERGVSLPNQRRMLAAMRGNPGVLNHVQPGNGKPILGKPARANVPQAKLVRKKDLPRQAGGKARKPN